MADGRGSLVLVDPVIDDGSGGTVEAPCGEFDTFRDRTLSTAFGNTSLDGRPWVTHAEGLDGAHITYWSDWIDGVDPAEPTDFDFGPFNRTSATSGVGDAAALINGFPTVGPSNITYGVTPTGGYVNAAAFTRRVDIGTYTQTTTADPAGFTQGLYSLTDHEEQLYLQMDPVTGDPWTTDSFQFSLVVKVTYTADDTTIAIRPTSGAAGTPGLPRQHVVRTGDHLTGAGITDAGVFGDGVDFNVRVFGAHCDLWWVLTFVNGSGDSNQVQVFSQYPSTGTGYAFANKGDWVSGQEYLFEGYADQYGGMGVRVYPVGGTVPPWTLFQLDGSGILGMDESAVLIIAPDYMPPASTVSWHDLTVCSSTCATFDDFSRGVAHTFGTALSGHTWAGGFNETYVNGSAGVLDASFFGDGQDVAIASVDFGIGANDFTMTIRMSVAYNTHVPNIDDQISIQLHLSDLAFQIAGLADLSDQSHVTIAPNGHPEAVIGFDLPVNFWTDLGSGWAFLVIQRRLGVVSIKVYADGAPDPGWLASSTMPAGTFYLDGEIQNASASENRGEFNPEVWVYLDYINLCNITLVPGPPGPPANPWELGPVLTGVGR